MGKTMQEEWPAEWPISACEWADQREETIEKLHGDIDRLRTRLAAYERNTIVRDGSVPEWAWWWTKDLDAGPLWCGWTKDADGEECLSGVVAPDLRPNEPGPITLPIVDVE